MLICCAYSLLFGNCAHTLLFGNYQVVFEVHCSATFSTVKFDIVDINIGNGWSSSTKYFTAPVGGIYYFSFSFGTTASKKLWYYLQIVNNSTKFCDLELAPEDDATKINGNDVSSRGCLIALNVGNSVSLTAYSASYAYASSSYGETSFRGFLYSPKQVSPVAWSVCSNSNQLTANGIVQFSYVYVNTGVWSPSSYSVTIAKAGTYYMEIGSQNDYAASAGNTDMRLTANGNTVILRLVISLPYCGYIIRSRSVIAHLNVGDVLKVQCFSCVMSGDGIGGIYFHGILLMTG